MKLKVAVLGAGNMGKCHAGNLIKLGIEITAVCDMNENARKTFKESLKLESVAEYSKIDDMIENSPFDMLYICLPPFAQQGQFQKAAKAGKHIFIEKPIALTTEEGRKMVQAAKDADVITQVGFHMRRGAAVIKLKELIDNSVVGRPVLFNGQYECNALHTPWWRDVNLSGGQIFEQAIHIYDICRYLMGEPVVVTGMMGNLCHSHTPNYTVEDVSASSAYFDNGVISVISATNCAIPGLWKEKFTAVFEKVTVFFENPNKARFAFIDGETVRYEEVDTDTDMKFDEDRDFVKAVRNNKKTNCSIDEGFHSLCYVESVVKSAKIGGCKVEVPKL